MNFEFNEMEPFESDQIDNNVAHSSVVLNSEEFTTYELNKLKGDSVGDTAYSGKWIINTLISLSKVIELLEKHLIVMHYVLNYINEPYQKFRCFEKNHFRKQLNEP